MQPPPSPVVLEYLDLDAPALALPTSSLDSAERERAARFHFEEDRRRFIHGRAWLRLRVAELLGIEPKAVEFTTVGERGKPAVASKLAPTSPQSIVGGSLLPTVASKLAPTVPTVPQSIVGGSLLPTGTVPTFNLSHSAQHGLLALHAGGLPLGVDLEVARQFERAARIAARHFNAAEAAAVAAAAEGAEREAVFFRTWTRKEAYLKLTGLGLPGGLACVETGTEAAARSLLVPAEHGLASAWVTSLELPASAPTGLLAALAAPCAVPVDWRRA
jgi:4'-phosphopantetheinyl transferase